MLIRGPARGKRVEDPVGEGVREQDISGRLRGAGQTDLNLTKEQQDKLAALRKRQWEELKPLRDQMYQKRQEMRGLYTSPATRDATIIAKQKELNALQQQMQDRMVQFRLEQRKIFTPEQLSKLQQMPYGRGRGACGGYGRGRGDDKGWITSPFRPPADV